jgi:hypothetical protein
MVATTLARGRLEGRQLVDVKDILICDPWPAMAVRVPARWARWHALMTTGASNGNAARKAPAFAVRFSG